MKDFKVRQRRYSILVTIKLEKDQNVCFTFLDFYIHNLVYSFNHLNKTVRFN